MAAPEYIFSLPTYTFRRHSPMTEIKSTKCEICFDDLQDLDKSNQLPCGHEYHEYCVIRWLVENNSCPTCRGALPDPTPLGGIQETADGHYEVWKLVPDVPFTCKSVSVRITGNPDCSMLKSALQSACYALLSRRVKMAFVFPPDKEKVVVEGTSTHTPPLPPHSELVLKTFLVGQLGDNLEETIADARDKMLKAGYTLDLIV